MRFVLVALAVLASCSAREPDDSASPAESAPASAPAAPVADTASSSASSADASSPDVAPASPSSCVPFAATTALATMHADEGPGCTIYRPSTLSVGHPVIVWGNGTGASVSIYGAAFDLWASHGFVVAAAQASNGQGAGKALLDCLDHVQKTYAANVCNRVGASGHSQGGGGAIMAGSDARIAATAPVEPYIQQGYGGFDQASIVAQNGVMLLLSGSADDNAVPSVHQKPVFDTTNVPVFWATLAGGDHYLSAYGLSGFKDIVLAWFRLHLMGDEDERTKFYGPSCAYCTNSKWTVQRKGL